MRNINIFQQINAIYTRPDSKWIIELDESEIQPYLIQRFLVMNERIREFVRWLDKYVFVLPPKMFLSLAWSVIPKSKKMPYVKYIKKEKEIHELDFILYKVKKHLNLSDSDFAHSKSKIIDIIQSDMPKWFAFYGITKPMWKKFRLDYDSQRSMKSRKEEEKTLWEF